MKQLDPYVESDYVIVLLYSGMKYKLSWGWLRQAYNLLDRKCVAALTACCSEKQWLTAKPSLDAPDVTARGAGTRRT